MTARRLSLVTAAIVIVLTVAALARQARDPNGEDVGWARGHPATDGRWTVVSLGPLSPAKPQQRTGSSDLVMRRGRLSWTLCNSHEGLYRVQDDRVFFRARASTAAFCPDPFEDQIHGALSGGPWRFQREGDRLVIQTVVGPLVLRRARSGAAAQRS